MQRLQMRCKERCLEMMLFSIVIPAHNGERYLAEALVSALAQERPADEIIVIDDASTDSTSAIARSPAFSGGVAYCYNEPATGFADAWNRAAAKASGDFVTILHQDDLLDPGYLARIEEALRRYPHVRHLYAACRYIDAAGKVTREPREPYSTEPVLYSGRDYARNYLSGVAANRHIHRCPGVTTNRRLLLDECAYRKEAGQIADDDFFLRVGAHTDVVGISAPLAGFRHHSGSTTARVGHLTSRLAEDYLFQTRCYKDDPGLLGHDDIRRIHSLAVRFINLLLFEGISYGDGERADRAWALRNEFDEIRQETFSKNLPIWARFMWSIAPYPYRQGSLAGIYVALLRRIIESRSAFNNRRANTDAP